jgi:hypothetical protein
MYSVLNNESSGLCVKKKEYEFVEQLKRDT